MRVAEARTSSSRDAFVHPVKIVNSACLPRHLSACDLSGTLEIRRTRASARAPAAVPSCHGHDRAVMGSPRVRAPRGGVRREAGSYASRTTVRAVASPTFSVWTSTQDRHPSIEVRRSPTDVVEVDREPRLAAVKTPRDRALGGPRGLAATDDTVGAPEAPARAHAGRHAVGREHRARDRRERTAERVLQSARIVVGPRDQLEPLLGAAGAARAEDDPRAAARLRSLRAARARKRDVREDGRLDVTVDAPHEAVGAVGPLER